MQKVRPLLLALATLLGAYHASATQLTGTITDAHGTTVTGYLYFTLSANGNVLSTGGCGGPLTIGPGQPIRFVLTNGAITAPGSAPYTIYGNDCMSPSGLYYRMEVFNSNMGFVLRKSVQISGASVDLGTISSYAPLPSSTTLGGDLTGTPGAATVVGIQGTSVSSTAPTSNQVLAYNGSAWAPTAPGSSTTLSVTGSSGAGYLYLKSQGTTVGGLAAGLNLYAQSLRKFSIVGPTNITWTFDFSAANVDQNYAFPNDSATVVLDTTSQTLTNKTLTAPKIGTCTISSGSGDPNSAVTGSVCDLYLRTDGGTSTTLYVKESGSATNTGWVGK